MLAVEVQGPDPVGRDAHGQSEDRVHPLPGQGAGEDRPAVLVGGSEVRGEHRASGGHRVQARPLAVGELQLVQATAQGAAGPEGAAHRPAVDEGDGGSIDLEQLDARPAEPVGSLQGRRRARDGGAEADTDHVHVTSATRAGGLAHHCLVQWNTRRGRRPCSRPAGLRCIVAPDPW